jgi:hypothetical protein
LLVQPTRAAATIAGNATVCHFIGSSFRRSQPCCARDENIGPVHRS